MPHLALCGGSPIRTKPLPIYNTIGAEEKALVMEVLDSGILSGFVGAPGDGFLGGPKVRMLEEEWRARFRVKHAVSMNTATSCLCLALKALDVGPGDEVIVTPFSMSATVTSILYAGATPIFCDVDARTFNLDAEKIPPLITPRTKAIMVADLLGHPAPMPEIRTIAKKHGFAVVEDNAQSAGATIDGKEAGTFGDIGIFSLNRHKIIQSGEGGVAVTDSDELALRLQLLRNHGENSVAHFRRDRDLSHLFGVNYRMTELEAAVSIAQLRKLDAIVAIIRGMAEYLSARIGKIPGLEPPFVQPGYTHVFLQHTLLYDEREIDIPRSRFVKAIQAEGFPDIVEGYKDPLYLLPLFRHRPECRPGLCPVAEHLHTIMVSHDVHRPPCTMDDMKQLADAFDKVCEHRDELRNA